LWNYPLEALAQTFGITQVNSVFLVTDAREAGNKKFALISV
jgi:hypothetical protein